MRGDDARSRQVGACPGYCERAIEGRLVVVDRPKTRQLEAMARFWMPPLDVDCDCAHIPRASRESTRACTKGWPATARHRKPSVPTFLFMITAAGTWSTFASEGMCEGICGGNRLRFAV